MKVLEKTKSICPKCMEEMKLHRIDANIILENNKVYMFKRCGKHGEFKDLLSEDPEWYMRVKERDVKGKKTNNPCETKNGCPADCGLCKEHKSVPLIANIEVTNRCNLDCPYCYAHYGKTGILFEPSYDDITKMIDMLAEYGPHKVPAVQFTGGEPTLHKHLPAMIAYAREKGIKQVQIATNGIRLAEDPDFCKKLRKSGLKTIYLKFNGTTPKTNPENLKYMDNILKNLRSAGFDSIILVPTIIKGVNDNEVGDIIMFGINNMDIIRGVNFQPVSFSGKMTKANIEKHRYTIDMLTKAIEKQTDGQIRSSDVYPATCVAPISSFVEQMKNRTQPVFSMDPRCGAGTLVYVSNGKLYPFPQFIDVDNLFKVIEKEAGHLKKSNNIITRAKSMLKVYFALNKYTNKKNKPKDFSFPALMFKVLTKGSYDSVKQIILKTFYIGAMHFQDCYNLDINRLQRCVVGVATPDLRIIPFCAYNNIGYRKIIENKFGDKHG